MALKNEYLNALKMDLSKKPMEVDDPSITQKKQSTARISSQEAYNVNKNPGIKRHKIYNLRSYVSESLELQVPSTSKLGTPTYNLTSSNTRTRRSTARQINVDIRDAIYKRPFEHGWKRELVYRKLGQSKYKIGDVYYCSPTNQKLRSLREIQKQLEILSDNDLTTENFTFLQQPIGMNDQSKELVRDAFSKLSKENSFAVGPKISEAPDEKNKLSSTMKIVLNNFKRSSRLRSKNVSSQEANVNNVNKNPGIKRQNRYNLRSYSSESLELQVPPTSKLGTPTYNLTSSNTITRRSTARQINVDIRDAIYKRPFEHGWKRELVYRKLGQSKYKIGDVYYCSPTNQKLRSLREIQEQLEILSDNDLTTENFTFLQQPIGMNDQSKELVRDAFSKLSKENSFAVGPKISKAPDEKNKLSSTMKIVLKNFKRSSRLRSKNVSSQDANNVNKNPGIKRHKKYNLRSYASESLELQVPPTSKLGTLTFNLSSSNTRTRRSTARQINVDIRDAIYKRPFEHGWKRELVYRKLGQSKYKIGDVYYCSPTNQKLRSLREIQKQLEILSDNDLTTENFTFLQQPIGMNDQSKELVRDAFSKLSKENSFAVGPKISEAPDEKNKLSSTMKIVLNNFKRSSRLRSKNVSSQEANVNNVNKNPGIKRQNRYNLRSYSSESLELQVPPTSKLGTLTFNLSSSNTRTRRSTARQINVDIRDAIYKRPFEHGWKRELVYRKLGQSKYKIGDVYYCSPTNQKLRSLREIQKQLEILSDNDLTTENFTFLQQPIGMNDQSKELVRDAFSKLSKENSFAVGPKISEAPDEKNKSSSTMKIVLKNSKRSSRLRSKNVSSQDANDVNKNPGIKRHKK